MQHKVGARNVPGAHPGNATTQALAADCPVNTLNRPDAQATGTLDWAGQKLPHGHRIGAEELNGQKAPAGHGLATLAPAGQYDSAGHATQPATVDNPTTPPYVPPGQFCGATAFANGQYAPTGQTLQSDLPVLALYLPTGHAVTHVLAMNA